MTHSPADHPALKKPIRLAGRGVFLDCEVSIRTREIIDFGAADTLGRTLHSSDPEAIRAFLRGADYFCGHNAVRHDIGCLMPLLAGDPAGLPPVVDTLALSVLLFPQRRFHALMKDEKLVAAEENNPLTDALKARDLCFEALAAFNELSEPMQQLLSALLSDNPLYQGFFRQTGLAAGEPDRSGIAEAARTLFAGEICERADVAAMARKTPAELGLTLAFIGAKEKADCLPAWVLRNFPRTQRILDKLRDVPCSPRCPRCRRAFDAASGLKRFFGFEAFRTFDGKPLQQMAAQAALEGESLLAVFPTGGGKSITFQVPALMQARSSGALTVVISPLQSLMKDQVDHLIEAGVEGACTVNGLLSPLERARAMEMVASGHASILYLSPEQLRSRTIEKLLSERRIARFVIDEAHCFSAWGHDFRVDYLYIADFIALLEKHQPDRGAIPVSCFTATAKQKVIADISEYFEKRLGLRLRLFATDAARRNLHYKVLHAEDQNAKYDMVRELLKTHACPSIVYVSRTKSAEEIAKRLTRDGIRTLPYHGQMESIDKTDVQDAFLAGQVRVIVATNAFGMGVDKKDVGLVIHYDISSSLENYVQEAGRAGRDPSLEAECYVLFNEDDLDKHFSLLMQSKLSQADIQQVWRAVKTLARGEEPIEVSALELAREAGWDTDSKDFETRMRTAIAALETAGYITRGRNAARVFASGLAAESFSQARALIVRNPLFADPDVCMRTLRIVQSLVSRRSTQDTTNREGESRTDYLSDRLGIPMPDVVDSIRKAMISTPTEPRRKTAR